MVPVGPDPTAAIVLERLRALPAGARLLSALDGVRGVHLVGGAVRDLLSGVVPREFDVVVVGDGVAVARVLAERLGGDVVRVHEPFGTATVEAPGGALLDVARARTETYARPGALPEVEPAASVAEDLGRRDFTLNAIAVGLSADVAGALTAVDGTLEDLHAGRLRVLHDASFVDDPTRLLRMVRYAARLGYVVEPGTEALARAAFAAGAPETAGVARIARELMLLLREPDPDAALALLADLAGDGLAPLRIDIPLRRRALSVLPAGEDAVPVTLAALLHGGDEGEVRAWLEAAHVPTPGPVLAAATGSDELAEAMRSAGAPSALHALLARRTVPEIALAGALGAEDEARAWFGGLRDVRLTIGAEDLLRAGVPQGRELGERLRAALAAKLDGVATTPDEELAAALGDGGLSDRR
ncbi:MAG TPA: hypothetical protein VN238_15370 [Solirubrobacteraceae bacterium]|nr:hypothetical protein [Solirubrobacteraceae bacterium]